MTSKEIEAKTLAVEFSVLAPISPDVETSIHKIHELTLVHFDNQIDVSGPHEKKVIRGEQVAKESYILFKLSPSKLNEVESLIRALEEKKLFFFMTIKGFFYPSKEEYS